ncbi:MAG: VWA domain-containing protein [Bryobacteraceae bacterium]|jgi:VWFA-related protein
MKRFLAFSLLIAGVASAQEPASIRTSGEEVLVDVVVRDKHGHAVTDLQQQSFSVLDDGALRQIASFRLVKGTEAISSSANGASTTQKLDPIRQIRLVSMIFDSLNQGERAATRKAALELLNKDFPQNVYMAVFTLGKELQAIQGFTNKRDLLIQAVEKATSRPSSQFSADGDALRAQVEVILGPNQAGNQDMLSRLDPAATAAGGANPVALGHRDMFEMMMARSLLDMISFSERTEMRQAGRSTVWALLAAVRGQSQLPGRKALIYFSEGFAIPQGAEEEFQAVISAANRNNLSFYPIDAHGLISSTSGGAATSTGLNNKATEGLAEAATASRDTANLGASGLPGAATVKTEVARSDDIAIDANRSNIQDTLAILADQTGGFLTANTNDFTAPLHRVMEEIDTYYEITYIPRIDKYDGKFRHIEVKVDNHDLTVQSRAGYFALPPDMLRSSGLNAYEVPLLRTLSDVRINPALPFESGGMHFRGEGNLETCGVLIDVPLSNVMLREERGKNMKTGGLAYLALIKDVKGAVVKKLQGEMPVELDPGQVLSFKQSRFTDVEYFDAAPGYYTIEVAILDRESGQTNARRSAMFVPKRGEGLGMSSVALIRKWRPKEPDAGADDPFVVGDKTVTPSLLPKINKSVSTSLPFYGIVYPSAHNTAKPEMWIEFNRDGNVKRVAAVPMDPPDSQGRIQYVANAPIDQFAPGNYAVRFLVRQGAEAAEENFALNLEP